MIQQILAIWSLVPLPFLNLAWTSGSFRFMYCHFASFCTCRHCSSIVETTSLSSMNCCQQTAAVNKNWYQKVTPSTNLYRTPTTFQSLFLLTEWKWKWKSSVLDDMIEWRTPQTVCSCLLSMRHQHFNKCLGNGTPLQYSCLENPMDRGAW